MISFPKLFHVREMASFVNYRLCASSTLRLRTDQRQMKPSAIFKW